MGINSELNEINDQYENDKSRFHYMLLLEPSKVWQETSISNVGRVFDETF